MKSVIVWSVATLLPTLAALSPALAQTCGKTQFAAVIDETGAKLRKQNSEAQPKFLARMRQLGAREGWPESQIEGRAYAFLADDETRALDEQAGSLLNRLDKLGEDGPQTPQPCDSLAELKTVSTQLLEVTAAKSSHVSARLDASLRSPGLQASKPPPSEPQPSATEAKPPAKAEARPDAAKEAPKQEAKIARPTGPVPVQPPPPSAAQTPSAGAPPPLPPPAAPRPPAWQTETVRETAALDTRNIPDLPPRLEAEPQLEFTVEDIRAAGRGLFGTISAELAGVIEYAFQSYGRPNGYILGNDGGAAFLAGLRYGEGKLVTKTTGEQKIYWQGPSVGGDFGLAGSRVLFLVYNLRQTDDMHARFAGIDGSAYFVGGVGITFLKKGRVVLAPIRSGLGLRIGANIGYLKFTPSPTLNPF